MRTGGAIGALREDGAAQRSAQGIVERARRDWHASPAVAAALTELDDYGQGAALDDCRALDRSVSDLSVARALVDPLVLGMGAALAERPLAHVPFRHQLADGVAVLQLARAGRATLSLIQYAPVTPVAAPGSVCFTDAERREVCLAGRADAREVTLVENPQAKAELKFRDMAISVGWTIAFAGRPATKIVDRIAAPVTLLRLSRAAERPLPSLEYRVSDNVLLHRAAGDCRESRSELMLALLGSMKRQDAVPAMLCLAREGSDSLRWQALRECLALDSAAGFRALAAIARDPADPLHSSAAALRAELRARHPQLARLELEPCPA